MAEQQPSAGESREIIPEAAQCPFCDGMDTKLLSPFGGQMSMAQYWCNRCRTGFEYIRWEDHDDEA